MATSHHRRRRHVTLFIATVTLLFLASVSASHQSIVGVSKIKEEVVERVAARRQLGGPGSAPPTCISKCGRCAPCQPVLVSIKPGFSIKMEYYPEAWRCKCGDKLFLP